MTLLVLNQATESREVLVELVTLDGIVIYSETLLLQPRAFSIFDTAELLSTALAAVA